MYYKANILFSLNNIRAYLVHAYKKYSQINFFLYLPVHFWLKNLAKALPHPEPSVRAPPHCFPVGRAGQSPAQSLGGHASLGR